MSVAQGRCGWRAAAMLAGAVLVLGSGCATIASDPRDPFEGFNRSMHSFNETFDDVLARPVARGYRSVVPEPIRDRVRNFFSNIGDVFIGVNNLLQGKPLDALNDWLRVGFNTTFGIFGLHDIASEMGLEKHDEDFGQTLGVWGLGTGPYLVLPLFGPSNLRDGAGLAVDLATDPLGQVEDVPVRNTLAGARAIGQRADLLDAGNLLDQAALDKYVFLRDAYLQRRRSLIYDGSPPRQDTGRDPAEGVR